MQSNVAWMPSYSYLSCTSNREQSKIWFIT